MTEKLSNKVIKGSFWITLSSIVGRSLNIISSVLLTRWLLPSDFGIMALIMSIIAFTQMSTTTGFGSALIQKQDTTKIDFDVAWTFELIKFVILFIVLFFTSPFLMNFFDSTENANLLRVMAFTLLFFGFRNIGIVFFRKELNFYKLFIFESGPLLIKVLVTLLYAYNSPNVWALIYGQMAYTISLMIFSYLLHEFRPKICFNINTVKSLFGFGKWILFSSLLSMIRNQGVIMLISKIFGFTLLGYFNRSMIFSSILFVELRELFWKTGYASLSKLQSNNEKFNNAFLDYFSVITLFGFPIAIGIFIIIPDFVTLFLGDTWINIIPIVRIFCIIGCLSFITTISGISFQALGKPRLNYMFSVSGLVLLLIILYPMIKKLGFLGVIYSQLVVDLVITPFIVYKSLVLLNIGFKKWIDQLFYSIICSLSMGVILFFIRNHLMMVNSFLEFFLIIVIGIFLFFSTGFLIETLFNYSVLANLLNKMKVAYKK